MLKGVWLGAAEWPLTRVHGRRINVRVINQRQGEGTRSEDMENVEQENVEQEEEDSLGVFSSHLATFCVCVFL